MKGKNELLKDNAKLIIAVLVILLFGFIFIQLSSDEEVKQKSQFVTTQESTESTEKIASADTETLSDETDALYVGCNGLY